MLRIPSTIPGLKFTESGNFFLLAGPCVVEGYDLCMEVAEKLIEITNKFNIPYVFKASFRKANRTRIDSFTGLGDETSLEILQRIKTTTGLPIVTDIHEAEEAEMAATVADILQIPAFLCRQTNLIKAAAETGKWVNVKKGQFSSPESMKHAVDKVRGAGSEKVMLTERGTSFGYSDLLVDFRGIPTMKSFDVPVVLDVTHALQQPNQMSGVTGGRPDLIPLMARAGMICGIDGLFMETHPEPSKALSDGANMIPLHNVERLLEQLLAVHEVYKKIAE